MSFQPYEDPMGKFENFRAMIGPEYNTVWSPHVPKVLEKECKVSKIKYERLDFKSELIEEYVTKLTAVGFKGLDQTRHFSIEKEKDSKWIVDAIAKEGQTQWNLVLLKVSGGEIVKLATMKVMAKKLHGRHRLDW